MTDDIKNVFGCLLAACTLFCALTVQVLRLILFLLLLISWTL